MRSTVHVTSENTTLQEFIVKAIPAKKRRHSASKRTTSRKEAKVRGRAGASRQ